MAEYIELEAVIEKNHGGVVYIDDIKSIPAADVAPVRHGRWLYGKRTGIAFCSECMEAREVSSPWCPNCGAKMDLEVPNGT